MGPRTVIALLHQGIRVVLPALVLAGCLGIAEDYRTAEVEIYNRTLTVVRFDAGWVARCSQTGRAGLPPWPSPSSAPPPGSVPITFDLGVPPDYVGVVSVIVSQTGVEVVRHAIGDKDLPPCAGLPPLPSRSNEVPP